jgi:phospholipase C
MLLVLVLELGCSSAAAPLNDACQGPTPDYQQRLAYDEHADDRASCRFFASQKPVTQDTVGPSAPAATAVQHVVIVMRENRSFDHYLGAYVPASGSSDVAPPGASNVDPNTLKPQPRYHETRYCIATPLHEWSDAHLQFDNGNLDGFVAASNDSPTNGGGGRAMGFYDERDLKFYYWLARNFAISDRYFSSYLGPTHPNLMFYWRATSCGFAENIDTNPLLVTNCGLRRPTIFSLLEDHNVTYQVYSDATIPNLSAAATFGLFDPFAVRSTDDFVADVTNDQLPQVAFVEPDYIFASHQDDEHPPTNLQRGQSLTYRVIAALMANPTVWSGTVAFISWDENGGYYDHVVPPRACVPDDSTTFDFAFDRYGFRVPFIVVSPFAKEGYVSHEVADHTSILRFIEHRWGLPPLTNRDANAWPLLDLFDFSQPRTVAAPDPALAAPSQDPLNVNSCDGGAPTGTP